VNRRQLIIGGAAAAWPLAARAQQPERMRRVGVLMPFGADDPIAQRFFDAMAQALRESGWSRGINISYETRYSEGNPQRLPALASELVRANIDVLVAYAAQAIDAAGNATKSIPIVMPAVGDALGAGYVASLARPGGNITGITLVATDQSAKRLEFVKQLSASIVRVAAIWNKNASGHQFQMKELEPAAPLMGIRLQSLPVVAPEDIDPALQAALGADAQAVVVMEDPMIQSARGRIAEFGIRHRLPSIGEFRPIAAAGGLMSYGPDLIDLWRRAGGYVDKILKGRKPADLPVEQPDKYQLVINLKTASAIGLSIPPLLLVAADEVIE
jgi:putative tryptophan/tyrosine transport system substrate-binding protein